jgi:hypothetical protein
LFVIVAILVAAQIIQKEFREFAAVTSVLPKLQLGGTELKTFMGTKENELTERVSSLKSASSGALKQRLDTVENEIQKNKSMRRSTVARQLALLTGDGFIDDLKGDIDLQLLNQERDYLQHLHSVVTNKQLWQDGQTSLEGLRQTHVAVFQALQNNQSELRRLTREYPIKVRIPGFNEYSRLTALKRQHQYLIDKNKRAHEDYQRQHADLARIKKLIQSRQFEISRAQVEAVLQPLHHGIAELDKKYRNNWVSKFTQPIYQVLPTALAILLSLMLTPIVIKAFFYFVIAPAASRRTAICLLPDSTGAIDGKVIDKDADTSRMHVSAVSQALSVDEAHELLVHPEYLQSSSHKGVKDTKWLLDWEYPMSSLASGMVALTRIRATSDESFVISATKDPFSEIGVISIPDGSAIVLQPHNLVGIVQRRDRPIAITRHWRLGSLNAWLTLQLRYLVFHGPAKLIVKGCRGVRVEQAGNGQVINQASTIGFSANLAYSTTRCETFASYLMGKQELFNDKFSGGPGFYVYEEMPHFGKKTGITGRGFEGITDSLMKVFGI